MNIEEQLAEQYLQNNEEEMKNLIKSAYLEGYKMGIQKSMKIKIDDIEYVDLGLPSGTLWSGLVYEPKSEFCNKQPFSSVCNLNLPSVDDFHELMNYCRVNNYDIIGPNGNRIGMYPSIFNQGELVPQGEVCFWLKSDVSGVSARCMIVRSCDMMSSLYFTGYRLPYLLVKK